MSVFGKMQDEMEAKIAELKAENEQLQKKYDDLVEDYMTGNDICVEQRRLVGTLRKALEKYGTHELTCNGFTGKCTCGFEQVKGE